MSGWAGRREPQPWRREPLLAMPVDSPPREDKPVMATRRDGSRCDIWRSLGMARRPGPLAGDRGWYPVWL